MKRKDYQKPTMQVVKLQQQAHLLQASGQVNATMNGTWEEEYLDDDVSGARGSKPMDDDFEEEDI